MTDQQGAVPASDKVGNRSGRNHNPISGHLSTRATRALIAAKLRYSKMNLGKKELKRVLKELEDLRTYLFNLQRLRAAKEKTGANSVASSQAS